MSPTTSRSPLLFIVLLVTPLALLSGCSSVKTGDASVSHLAKNTLVIRNHTAYLLEVFRNGVVWELPENQDGRVHWGAMVEPQQELVLYDVSTRQNECINLMILETKKGSFPVGKWIFGERHFKIHAGTNSPPTLVAVRTRWGYSPGIAHDCF